MLAVTLSLQVSPGVGLQAPGLGGRPSHGQQFLASTRHARLWLSTAQHRGYVAMQRAAVSWPHLSWNATALQSRTAEATAMMPGITTQMPLTTTK